jgi:hypothetical protein
MSMKTTREAFSSTEPAYGFNMRSGDSVKSTKAGLDVTSAGHMYVQNLAGTIVQEFPSNTVGLMVYKLAVAGGAGSSGVFASAANPFGYDVVITSAVLDVTTQSSGAATVDIGVGADATTSNDGLIDGLSVAAAGIFNNEDGAGTNGRSAQRWTSSTFLNVAEASGDVSGLVGNLYVTCYRR